jgi:hypothetical protein
MEISRKLMGKMSSARTIRGVGKNNEIDNLDIFG